MRLITTEERRHRLGSRHILVPSPTADAPTIPEISQRLVGLHSSDPTTVFLSIQARLSTVTHADIERSLYEEPVLFRVLGMRRTMFAVCRSMVPLLHHGCALPMAQAERRRLIGYIEQEGFTGDAGRWLDRVGEATLAEITRRGPVTAMELREDVPELKETIGFGEGKKWGGRVGLSTRVLFLLSAEGKIIRGRPKGSWLSGQYRWMAMEKLFPHGIPSMETHHACRQLLAHWLRSYGPGTETDLVWWTGWTKGRVRETLADLEVKQVVLEGDETGWVMLDDEEPTEPLGAWVAFLPSLDSTIMGWKRREWFLGSYADRLFDRNGNAGPTVWWEGKVVGGWSQTPDGRVVYKLLEDIGQEGSRLVVEKAAQLEGWMGGTQVIPRFGSPLSKELAQAG